MARPSLIVTPAVKRSPKQSPPVKRLPTLEPGPTFGSLAVVINGQARAKAAIRLLSNTPTERIIMTCHV